MDGKGRATDNAFIERFFRTIKYEKIYLEHPETGNELHQVCSQFIHYYNVTLRPEASCFPLVRPLPLAP